MPAEIFDKRINERPYNFSDMVAHIPLGYKRIKQDDTIAIGGRLWDVHIGNGHAPEHATLWSRDGDIVIAGDQIIPNISSNLGVYPTEPDADPVGEWFEACERFATIATGSWNTWKNRAKRPNASARSLGETLKKEPTGWPWWKRSAISTIFMISKSKAEWAYERIILYIQKFEEQLDGDHEVVMGFVGGGVGSMHVQGMGFFAPDLVTFYGVDEGGTKTQMVQHVSQLNVTLKATVKQNKEADPTRIGFLLEKELKKKKKPTRAKGRSDKRKKSV